MKAIVGGSVLSPSMDAFIERGVILVDGSSIVAVGGPREVAVPDGAEVVSAEAGYVVPGLIDAHNHLYMDPGPFEDQSLDPEIMMFLRGVRNARKQLRDGVTTLRECGTPKFVDLRLKEAIDEGLVPGPSLICAGQWITASHGHGAFPGAAAIADGTDAIRRAVREVLRQGVDFVKVMVSGATATRWADPLRAYLTYDELKVIVDEVHDQGKQVAAHIHGGPGVRPAVEAGIDTLEHGSLISDDREIDLIASRGVAWMFNQGARLADPNPLLPKFEQDKILASRATSIAAFKKARAAGVKIMSGPDGYHDDHASVWALEALVKSGATPREALRAATITPAEVLGLAGDRGTLAPGKRADLLIVGSNPLENISALREVRLVMKEGCVYQGL